MIQEIINVEASHPTLAGVFPGTQSVEILKIEVKTKGMLAAHQLSGMLLGAKNVSPN